MKSLQSYMSESLHTEEESLFLEYLSFIEYHSTYINEGVIDWMKSIPGKLKPAFDLIKQITELTKSNISDIIKLFSDSKIFSFFQKIGFSLQKVFDLIKIGFDYYDELFNTVAKYMHDTGITKWTEKHLVELDRIFKSHVKLKHIAGAAIAGLLLYIWFAMSFTGNPLSDFDMSDIVDAFVGKFNLVAIFGGPQGLKLLGLLATGVLGVGVGYFGAANSTKFAIGLIKTIGNKYFKNIKIHESLIEAYESNKRVFAVSDWGIKSIKWANVDLSSKRTLTWYNTLDELVHGEQTNSGYVWVAYTNKFNDNPIDISKLTFYKCAYTDDILNSKTVAA